MAVRGKNKKPLVVNEGNVDSKDNVPLMEMMSNFVQALGNSGNETQMDPLLRDMGHLFISSMMSFNNILKRHAGEDVKGVAPLLPTSQEKAVSDVEQPKIVKVHSRKKRGTRTTNVPPEPKAEQSRCKKLEQPQGANGVATMKNSNAKLSKAGKSAPDFENAPTPKLDLNCENAQSVNLDIYKFVERCTIGRCGNGGAPLGITKLDTQMACESEFVSEEFKRDDAVEGFLKAAFDGNLQNLQSFTVDVNYTDGVGRMALHYACAAGSLECVEHLLSMGANVNVADKKGWAPLHICTVRNLVEIAKMLIEAGADINAPLKHRCAPSRLVDVYSPCIHFAAMKSSAEMTLLLMSNGADINHKDSAGMTPLHYAAFRPNSGYIDFLANHGADFKALDSNGRCVFHSVALSGCMDVAQALVKYTEYQNLQDIWSLTPLNLAQIRQHEQLCTYFTEELKEDEKEVEDINTVLSSTIAVALQEPKVDQIHRCVSRIGPQITKIIFDMTMQIERNGGIRTCDNRRRRTSGGIFFTFLKELYHKGVITKEDYTYIRAAENEKRCAKATERRNALRSKLPHMGTSSRNVT
ncbi:bifunctional Ankyrin repeat/Ankyrin repeat-containing domain superfamily/Phosphorylated adapter RNA export protein [Babesia duncani]|uniref:Bifunctional Ankyrin repeat/Ankyrin repeat-containing domain superfamily/Phosphorylated adapter RNA export protein n=1 Tax=Babesia duncani TaxID=323732 RepID=A0AAD9PMN0_9APIC|nr:bifunctional Ankyrin repeat/Ankyrin repeat-containing domain superfamily/Phosphorylated adapter RNA export protein [Babesia duncani]